MDGSLDSLISQEDVLCGRGGKTNNHTGNIKYRSIVCQHQPEYSKARRMDKVNIARRIVEIVHARGGRFLKRADRGIMGSHDHWLEIEDKKAIEKTSQALREKLCNRQVDSCRIASKGAIRRKHGHPPSSARRGISETVEKKKGATETSQKFLVEPSKQVSVSSKMADTHLNNCIFEQSSNPVRNINKDDAFFAFPLYYDTGDTDDSQCKDDVSLADATEFISTLDFDF